MTSVALIASIAVKVKSRPNADNEKKNPANAVQTAYLQIHSGDSSCAVRNPPRLTVHKKGTRSIRKITTAMLKNNVPAENSPIVILLSDIRLKLKKCQILKNRQQK